VRVIYPPGLTPTTQVAIAVFLVVFNAGVYAWTLRRQRT